METHQQRPDDGAGDSRSEKLIPEWGESADNQIIYFALALLAAAVLLGYGCTRFGGDDDTTAIIDDIETGVTDIDLSRVASTYDITARHSNGTAILIGEVASEELRDEAEDAARRVRGIDRVDNRLTVADSEPPPSTETTLPDPGSLSPDVDAAVSAFAGVNGSASLTEAILEGVVDNAAQSAEAETAALAVPGIESVDNRLRVLQPDVLAALEGARVSDPEAEVTDAVAIVRGFVGNDLEREAALTAAGSVPGISSVQDELVVVEPAVAAALADAGVETPEATASTAEDGSIRAVVLGGIRSEEDRAAALAASSAVPGVDEVVDQLEITGPSVEEVTEEVNQSFETNPIQFASGSATILEESFATLEAAVAVLVAAPPDALFEVQGYTDIAGPAEANLTLSQARADAVREFLIERGVADTSLTAVGYGETEQFAPGTDAEALEANRRVRIEAR